MTVPTKAAMKQLLDERMIAGSSSNWLPPAMFFLQLNLSGVIILLSLMFYANALGESFVRGLVVVFFLFFSCSSVVWCTCGYILWLNVYGVPCVRGSNGGGVAFGCVCVFTENICILLNPACVALIISSMHRFFSLMEITRLKSHHTTSEEEGDAARLSQRALLQRSQQGEHPARTGSPTIHILT